SVEKFQVIVSGGITMGHPCCKSFRCTDPLLHSRNHFCYTHQNLADICAVDQCVLKIVLTPTTKQSCNDPAHCAMEEAANQQGQSMFALTDHL
ncbi:hypothetical protein CONPUDRAFT_24598, partial [Coniophora puteana RWD-64-598 SS2]